MNRTLSGTAVAVVLILSLAACGGSTTPAANRDVAARHPTDSRPTAGTPESTPSASVDANGAACGLVTAAEVTIAIGKPSTLTGGAGPICTFGVTADPGTFVYVTIYPDDASMAVPKNLDTQGTDHLTGLGDEAFWVPVAGTIFVRKGSRAFTLSLPSFANLTATPEALKTNMVALAQAALARF